MKIRNWFYERYSHKNGSESYNNLRGSITGALRNAEYPLIAIAPRSTLAWSGST